MVRYITENNIRREMTSEEETAFDNEQNAMRVPNKLKEIRQLRNGLLQDTDWWVLKGDITDEQTAWRKSLRDLPQNNTTEAKYDELLATDDDGNLTHSVWSKP
jgi:hypothetical protein